MHRILARSFILAVVSSSVAIGCAAESDDAETASESGADLKSAECPQKIALTIGAFDILTDAQLLSLSEKDAQKQGAKNWKQLGELQFEAEKDRIAAARAEKPVTLSGTVGNACHYKLTDTKGADSAWSVWLAKGGNNKFSLRMMQYLEKPDSAVYVQRALTAVSATTLTADPAKRAQVYAENTSRGHDGSDGWSAWIGSADIKVEIAH